VLLDGAVINGIEPATLRHRLVVDALTDTLDSVGEPVRDSNGDVVRTWEEFATLSADIQPVTAREILAEPSIYGETDTKFVIRSDAITRQITQLHRLRFGELIYDIVKVIHVAYRGTRIEILAKSGVNDG